MCLENVSERFVALEDIPCYKRLKKSSRISLGEVKHGDSFEGIINEVAAVGKISIEESDIYFCTNTHRGRTCKEKFGFKHSWINDSYVEVITVNGKTIITPSFRTPYRFAPIEIGNTYESILEKPKSRAIEIGLHTFKFSGDAISDMDSPKEVIVRCIIPKGSTYYEGDFGGSISYASDKLQYVEIIKIPTDGKRSTK